MGLRFDPYKPHHPVFPNCGNRRRLKRGRFCGDLAACFERSRSLRTITVSRVDFWPPVSASKNSVPGGRLSGRLTSRRDDDVDLPRADVVQQLLKVRTIGGPTRISATDSDISPIEI